MQLDPEAVYETVVDVVSGKSKLYRNVTPKAMKKQLQTLMAAEWEVTQNSGTGKRDNMVQQAYDMKPGTPAKTFILDKLLKSF